MECGLCRCGRSGVGGTIVPASWLRGEKAAFPDQEAVSRDAQGGVVVEAAPAAAFEMAQAHLLLELLIVALDPPAQGGGGDKLLQAGLGRQAGEPEALLGSLALAALAQKPLLGPGRP